MKERSVEKEFFSLHARVHQCGNRFCSLYEIGRTLSSRQMQQLIDSLHQRGLPVESLEFFEYGPSDTLRHLFIRMKGQPDSIPYFQLASSDWQILVEELLKAT